MPMLTEDEARVLPDGTRVRVIWSGGNSPHTYEVGHWPNGEVCLQLPDTPLDRNTRHAVRLVGHERFHTRVWLASDPEALPAGVTRPGLGIDFEIAVGFLRWS